VQSCRQFSPFLFCCSCGCSVAATDAVTSAAAASEDATTAGAATGIMRNAFVPGKTHWLDSTVGDGQ